MSTDKLSVQQLKAARALLGWSQRDLAAASGVSLPTIRRIEAGGGELGGRQSTTDAIRLAVERGGVEILHKSKRGGVGVRLR